MYRFAHDANQNHTVRAFFAQTTFFFPASAPRGSGVYCYGDRTNHTHAVQH